MHKSKYTTVNPGYKPRKKKYVLQCVRQRRFLCVVDYIAWLTSDERNRINIARQIDIKDWLTVVGCNLQARALSFYDIAMVQQTSNHWTETKSKNKCFLFENKSSRCIWCSQKKREILCPIKALCCSIVPENEKQKETWFSLHAVLVSLYLKGALKKKHFIDLILAFVCEFLVCFLHFRKKAGYK